MDKSFSRRLRVPNALAINHHWYINRVCQKLNQMWLYILLGRLFQEWPEICISVPRVRRTLLMWLWSLMMVSGWRHTRWSWLPPAASVWQKIAKTSIRIHWSLWEEFRALSNTVGTFDFWRTLSLHLIQILSATFYAFSSFWSGVGGVNNGDGEDDDEELPDDTGSVQLQEP